MCIAVRCAVRFAATKKYASLRFKFPDTSAALVSSRLDYTHSVLHGSQTRCSTRLQRIQNSIARILLQQPSRPHGTHFSNFIGFLSNGGYSLSWLPLPTKSYTPVHRYICLNASILTFLIAPCDHPPPLTCTSVSYCSSNSLEFSPLNSPFVSNLK